MCDGIAPARRRLCRSAGLTSPLGWTGEPRSPLTRMLRRCGITTPAFSTIVSSPADSNDPGSRQEHWPFQGLGRMSEIVGPEKPHARSRHPKRTVVDGSGGAARSADVAIDGERITAVGTEIGGGGCSLRAKKTPRVEDASSRRWPNARQDCCWACKARSIRSSRIPHTVPSPTFHSPSASLRCVGPKFVSTSFLRSPRTFRARWRCSCSPHTGCSCSVIPRTTSPLRPRASRRAPSGKVGAPRRSPTISYLKTRAARFCTARTSVTPKATSRPCAR